ncbi:hypothetical protein JCM11641_006056 [Rhodosporidiobolus odoratus]
MSGTMELLYLQHLPHLPSNSRLSSSTLSTLAGFITPLWALLLVLIQSVREFKRRRRRPIYLEDDDDPSQPRQKPLFSVFVEDADILATEGVSLAALGTEDGVQASREAVLPPPPLALMLVPTVEQAAWWGITLYLLARRQHFELGMLSAAGRALSWTYAFFTQLSRRTSTAPVALLSLYLIFLLDAVWGLVDFARKHSDVYYPRLLDLLLVIYLVGEIFRMPLSAPLDILIKVAQGGVDHSTRPRSPEDSNTVLGALTYSWMNEIMRVARSRPLLPSDVFNLALNNRAEVLSRRFSSLHSKTLTRRLLRASARDIAIDASLKLVASTSEYLRPYFIQKILENLTLAYSSPSPSASSHSPAWTPIEKAYLFTALAFLSMLCKTLAQQRHFHYARRIGMRLRSELTVEVFEKALERRETPGKGEGGNAGEGKSASTGKVVSMISEDVNRVLRMGCDSHLIYGAPLEIILGVSFLYNLMGWSAFVAFAILALSSPLTYWLGKRIAKISQSRSTARDRRQTSLQELVSDIRTIKLFGWSQHWIGRVEGKRGEELRWAVRDFIVNWLSVALWSSISLLVPLASFAAYVKLQHQELTIAVAFTALSLFSLIRGPLNQIPGFSLKILQLRVSIGRLEAFFAEDEISPHATPSARAVTTKLAFKNATLRYAGAEEGQEALSEVHVEFALGELTMVSGPTGSGKSSLLLGLLGELEIVTGTVELPPAVSYAAQHPWLESLSVKDNVLFGYPADEKRYRAVIKACALEPDLAFLSEGDQTHVGERGVSLSGGQKARLALARAVYAPTSHILLDDIFAAVDAHTARHLVEHLFRPSSSSLLRGRTVVVVTHHVDLVLPYAAYHVELEDGRVISQGKVEKVEEEKIEEELERMEHDEEDHPHKDNDPTTESHSKAARKVQPGRVEGWATGEVKLEMYKTYLASSSYLVWALVAVFLLARPAFSFGEQFWLRQWGEAAQRSEPVDSSHYLAVYALIGAGTSVDTLLATCFIYMAALRGSRSLFHKLLVRVVHAPLRWFDVVPLGTIQNRFTSDIGTVDDALALNISEFAGNIISMVASLTVVSVVLPAALASSIVFALTYAYIFRAYLSVSRDVNRIAATTASPLFSSFGEAVRGITTIRAFAKQKAYRTRLCEIIDTTLSCWYLNATLDVWLSIRTQLLSAFCLLATATFATYTRVSPGIAGIAITSSQSVIMALDYLANAYGRLVLSFNSLERITEYLEVPQEPLDGKRPPADWPSLKEGNTLIEVRDLVMKYDAELPPVLHGISFEVKAGERIGIVGRTGSGKSTLATSLLRFADPASGSIHIDGLDISSISLTDLRQRITLVPQEAALFAGTLRENLDPLNEHTDAECYSALGRVHLLDPPTLSRSGSATPCSIMTDNSQFPMSRITLEHHVSHGGTNWSAGQRQLIALARALLRDSRIVILDESSAALDHRLDSRLQRIMRDEFRDAAVLVIAHRLRTILDSDRILVLDAGRIVELDTPTALLAKEGGVFRDMWEKSGGKTWVDE